MVHASVGLYPCSNLAEPTSSLQVISPILVIKRVAQGNDVVTMAEDSSGMQMSNNEPERMRSGRLQSIQFVSPHDCQASDLNMSQALRSTS